MTPIDLAHAAMEAAPEDATLRLKFYERVADAELFLLLEDEAAGDKITPMVFPVEGHEFVLAFDREERLAAFAERVAPFVALSGRRIVALLEGQALGLGLNLAVAPSSMLLLPDAVIWLRETVSGVAEEVEGTPQSFGPPVGISEGLLGALDAKLASAQGLAQSAYLVAVDYDDGRHGHLLGCVDPLPGAEQALAQAVQEALVFSGIEAGSIDVGFFAASDPVCGQLAKVGLRFDIPVIEITTERAAPGSDPDKPPILR